MLGIDSAATSKAMPVVTTDGTLVLGLVRGDDRLSEAKLIGGARERLPPRDRRGDPRGVRRRRRLARPGRRRRRGHRRRGAARGAVRRRREPRRLAPPRRRGRARLRAALRGHPRGTRGRRVPGVRRRSSASRRRSRSATSSSSGRATRSRSARRSSTRTGPRSRSSEAATASGRRASMAAAVEQSHDENGIVWPRVDRAVRRPRARAPRGRRSRSLARAEKVADDARPKAASTSSSTTATSARARSSPTPISSVAPLRVIAGKKTLEDGTVDVRRRDGSAEDRVPVADVLKWVRAGLMAKRRRYSDEHFGPTIERLMVETGTTYRGLADKADLSAGYLNHIVHGNRPVPSNDVIARIATALGVEAEHFREYRIRVITEKLERCPSSSTGCTSAWRSCRVRPPRRPCTASCSSGGISRPAKVSEPRGVAQPG